MAELADAHGSGPCPVTGVRVQVPLRAVISIEKMEGSFEVLQNTERKSYPIFDLVPWFICNIWRSASSPIFYMDID